MSQTIAVRKAVIGASIGNAVEWFDFAIYGFLATFIAANFFPSGNETAALLNTFAIFAGVPILQVIGLTTFNEDELLSGALRAGAAGFVLKDSSAEELIRAERAVAQGHSYLDPVVIPRVLDTYRQAPGERSSAVAVTELTARELDVLRLIGRGHSNAEIAEELCISGVAVKSHIGRIFAKLQLRDRGAAIVYAYDHGIVAPQ